MRQEADSRDERLGDFGKEDVGGRDRVATDEERVLGRVEHR